MKKLVFIVLCCIAILTACNQDCHFTNEDEATGLHDLMTITLSAPDTTKTVDMNQAMVVGQRFMSNMNGSRATLNGVKDLQFISSDGKPLYYIINYEGGGYIIVSATKDYYPVIAYSEDGYFSTEKAKESGVSTWMDMQEEIINNTDALPDSLKSQISLLWSQYNTKKKEIALTEISRSDPDMNYQISYSISEWQQQGYTVYNYTDFLGSQEYISLTPGERNDIIAAANGAYSYGYTPEEIYYIRIRSNVAGSTTVQPLTSTKWNQINGYNKYVPNFEPDSANYWPLGCTTIAMAQIMRKHAKPSDFRWDLFPNNYYNDSLAMFLYRVAQAINVDFHRDESGSNTNRVWWALNFYGYNHSKIMNFDLDTIHKQLINGLPLYMRGSSNNKGHAWVCDGYHAHSTETEISGLLYAGENSPMAGSSWHTAYSQTRYSSLSTLSMNWGWGGVCNGFYEYNNFNPRWPNGKQFHYTGIQIIYDIY